MDLFFLLVCVLVSVYPSSAHNRRRVTHYGDSRPVRPYDDLLYDYDNRNVVRGRGSVGSTCYDLCYDAHVSGSRALVRGCVCSRYDFTGIAFGGGFNQRRYSTPCSCPTGTVCVTIAGRRRSCVRRSSVSRPSYPMNTGLPRRFGGHCGHLSSVCQASQRDLNQLVRFTYNYQLGRCVRERVHSICSPLGTRNNIFASLRNCNRICL